MATTVRDPSTFDALEALGRAFPQLRGYYARSTEGADLEHIVRFLAPLVAKSKAPPDVDRPICSPPRQSDAPLWQQVNALFERHGMSSPDWRLRDELVGWLEWARHGELLNQGNGTFQSRVHDWMLVCFGEAIAADVTERNHRFLEEALELVQAKGCTASEAHQLVDYVYGRDVGEVNQEAGGVLVTLAALLTAAEIDMALAGETELARVWTKVEQIRAKQAAKPRHSPLPA